MNKNKIYMDLDVNLNQIKSVTLKQYNYDSQWLVIQVTENGKPFYLEEQDVCIFKMRTPDGREIYNDSVFTDNMIVVEITKNCCTNEGTGEAELNIIDENTHSQIATFNFYITIEKSVYNDDDIEGSSEFASLTDRIIEADKAIADTKAAIQDLQDKLDSRYFVLTADKDVANGVPSLNEEAKIPLSELYESSTSGKGIVQLTDSITSTSITTAATPNSVKQVYDAIIAEENRATTSENTLDEKKADLASPTLTGTPKAPTAAVGTNTGQIATTSFVQTAVGNGISASDAMIIKGTIGTDGTVSVLPSTYKTGWTYRVVTAGTYAGEVCQIGDLIIALTDRDGSDNSDSDWCVVQTNINGVTTGNSSDDIVTFISNDNIDSNEWTDVPTLVSNEKHSSIFNKISTMFKNMRYLYKMIGTTDISTIGGGTVTGAVNALNTNLSNLNDSFFYDQTYNDGNVRVIVNLFGKLCQIYVMLKAPVSNYTLNLKVINPKLAARYTVFITPRAYVIGYITDSILIISGDNHITEQNIGQGSFVFLVR